MNHYQTAVFHALRTPERRAISDSDTVLNRADFVLRIQSVAASLQAMGVHRGDRVCVLMQNSIDLVALYYATALTGFILVPINTRYDHRDLHHALSNSRPRLVLFDGKFADRIAPLQETLDDKIRWVRLEANTLVGEPAFNPQTRKFGAVDENDVSLILYTSGTTSKPKGAMLTHRNLVSNSVNYAIEMEISERSSSILATPLFHIGGFGVLNGPILYAGGALQVVGRFDPDALFASLTAPQPSHLFLLSTMWVALTDHPKFAEMRYDEVAYVQTAASPLSDWRQEIIRKVFPNAEFGWGFGMTESCVTSIKNCTTREILDHPGSIGYVWRHVAARLVDSSGEFLDGPGQIGELQVKGPTIFPGYWDNTEATKEAFTNDGWLKTGDHMEFDADGYAYFRGRAKDMIKTGGENVAALEVEECLAEHLQVSDAAVFGLPHEYWGEEMVAVIVPTPGAKPDVVGLRDYCRANLSGFKVPKRIYVMDEVPKSSSGKVQKFMLRQKILAMETGADEQNDNF